MKIVSIFFILCATSFSSLAQGNKIEQSIDVVLQLCLAGGSVQNIAITTGESVNASAGNTNLSMSRVEFRGLASGLNAKIDNLSAQQATQARNCAAPFISSVLDKIYSQSSDYHRFQAKLEKVIFGLIYGNLNFNEFDQNAMVAVQSQGGAVQRVLRDMGKIKKITYVGEAEYGVRRFNVDHEYGSRLWHIALGAGKISFIKVD